MNFDNHKAIYLQICDLIESKILEGTWEANEKIPSVRRFAIELEVNPNTITNSFSELMGRNIIYNKRGIGYFVSQEARKIIIDKITYEFYEKELPLLFHRMELCNIPMMEIEKRFNNYQQNKNFKDEKEQ